MRQGNLEPLGNSLSLLSAGSPIVGGRLGIVLRKGLSCSEFFGNAAMTPERWQHITRIFQAAREHRPAGRDVFVEQAYRDTRMRT